MLEVAPQRDHQAPRLGDDADLRMRLPPLAKRRLNHCVNALSGCSCSHFQACSTSIARTRLSPLIELFAQLQRRDRLRKDIAASTLVRLFLSLNLGYLVGRHVLAQDRDWQPDAEIDAVARLFSAGAGAS